MKKVGIVTSNTSFANNYGAVLQCYALCEQLKLWGFEPKVINYLYLNNNEKVVMGSNAAPSVLGRIKYMLSSDVNIVQKIQYRLNRNKRKKMNNSFIEFYKNNLDFHAKNPATYHDLVKNPLDYEYFITGSDQVWNPVIHNNENDKGCFLQFAPENSKRIAYAPSFGIRDFPESLNDSLNDYLKTFDAVSVREVEGQEIVEKATGEAPQIVLDPTLMADPKVYEPISDMDLKLPEHYILCYCFGKMPYSSKIIKNISKKLKLPVVELPLSIESYAKGSRLCYDVDPSRFIGAIKGADLVLTDSFHCTVFSILNKKPFYTFLRQSATEKNNMNGRMIGLLNKLALGDRLITPDSNFYFDKDKALNTSFECSEEILRKERKTSQEYLKKALGM